MTFPSAPPTSSPAASCAMRPGRVRHSQTPILLLTARGDADDRIRGLEAGADDYLPKPFDPRELLLRITAILRRVPKPAPRPGPRPPASR